MKINTSNRLLNLAACIMFVALPLAKATELGEFLNTIMTNNPGKITIKADFLPVGIGAETENTVDGGSKITVNMMTTQAEGIHTVRHELMHVTSHLNDDPFNFAIEGRPIQGFPDAVGLHDSYDYNFHASEVSAYFTQMAIRAEFYAALAKESPADLLAYEKGVEYFDPMYSTAVKAVNDINAALAKTGVRNELVLNGVSPVDGTGISVDSAGNVSLTCKCSALGGTAVISLSKRVTIPPGTLPTDARRIALAAVTKKITQFRQMATQMNPNTATGKAIKAKNAAALAKAITTAKAAIAAKETPISPKGNGGRRLISGSSGSSSREVMAYDANPEVTVRRGTVTTTGLFDADTGEKIQDGYTITTTVPTDSSGNYNDSDNGESSDTGSSDD